MIVRRYLAWLQTAPPEARAAATGALARAYLFAGMSAHERAEAERALTLVLDDEAPMVRQALAEALAHAAEAPRHLIAALADDESSVASIVLSRSTLLGEADLIDRVATGDALVQTAIAMRPEVPATIAAAIAEVAEAEAVAALAANEGAVIPAFSLARIVERHGGDPSVRDALMNRHDLPPEVRLAVVRALAEDMAAARDGRPLASGRGALASRDMADRACLAAIVDSPDEDIAVMVGHLRREGRLTPMLLLHGVILGDLRPLVAALVELTRQKQARVEALVAEGRGPAFEALVRKAGLPPAMIPVFEEALAARRSCLAQEYPPVGAALARMLAARTIDGCHRRGLSDGDHVVTALRRLEAEAARNEARLVVDSLLTVQTASQIVTQAGADAAEDEPLLLVPEMRAEAPAAPACAIAPSATFAAAAALFAEATARGPAPARVDDDHVVERLAMGAVAAALFAETPVLDGVVVAHAAEPAPEQARAA